MQGYNGRLLTFNGVLLKNTTALYLLQEHELREYEESTWVSSQEEAADLDEVGSMLFRRLFLYISGANANSKCH